MSDAYIVGWRHTKFGLEGKSIEDIMVEAAREAIDYEAKGLAPRGKGRRAIDDGIVWRDGRLPVNLSGGLKAKGHPAGPDRVSMHVMAALQLTNQAGKMQRVGAALGCVFNMGGSGVANDCSILEPVRSAR